MRIFKNFYLNHAYSVQYTKSSTSKNKDMYGTQFRHTKLLKTVDLKDISTTVIESFDIN